MNQELLKLSFFKCKICVRRLQYPIMQVNTFGNICGSCYERSAYTHVTENIELQEYLTKLSVPCNYVSRGCTFEGLFLNTCDHEKRCSLRDRICPFAYLDECQYIQVNDIITHFKECHHNSILIIENNAVVIQNPLNSPIEESIKVLVVNNIYLLLRTKSDTQNDVFLVSLYHLQEDNERSTLSFIEENEKFKFQSPSINTMHDSEFTSTFDIDRALKIRLCLLENLKLGENIKLILNYQESNINMEEIRSFECPVCFQYLLDKIFLCRKGHCLCSSCKKQLSRCPICHSTFSGRNHVLEDLSRTFRFPCTHFGCKKAIIGAQYEEHILNCFFKEYTCPECNWIGLHKDLLEHLQEMHKENINIDKLEICVNADHIAHVYHLIKRNILLRFCYSINNKGILILTLGQIGPSYSYNMCRWEVHIQNKNFSYTTIITDECVDCARSISRHISLQEHPYGPESLYLKIYIRNIC